MTADDAERRIRELEEQLQRERTEKQMYKEAAHAFLEQLIPDDHLTEEEEQLLLTQRDGRPILEIVASFERGEL